MCSCNDSNPARVFERTLRKARRGYACGECSKRIEHGDWYEEVRGLWEGGWDTFWTCLRCTTRREAWAKIECRPAFTQLHASIIECLITNEYDREAKRTRHLLDRDTGKSYLAALSSARANLSVVIAWSEAERETRYRNAAVARQQAMRAKRELGAGI